MRHHTAPHSCEVFYISLTVSGSKWQVILSNMTVGLDLNRVWQSSAECRL